MSVVQVLNVKLQRADQSVSWGFNLQGGKDFYSPLLIQKVNKIKPVKTVASFGS